MTTDLYFYRCIIPTAYALLPPQMASPRASAMILAIGLQESGFAHRVQVNGPARGFLQFEVAGVTGVRQHRATSALVPDVLTTLAYKNTVPSRVIQAALEHNDVLACVFGRLLLWTLPEPLPDRDDAHEGWRQYLAAWRPGRPHRERWDGCFTHAWDVVSAEQDT